LTSGRAEPLLGQREGSLSATSVAGKEVAELVLGL
jgi:hypothetical protein